MMAPRCAFIHTRSASLPHPFSLPLDCPTPRATTNTGRHLWRWRWSRIRWGACGVAPSQSPSPQHKPAAGRGSYARSPQAQAQTLLRRPTSKRPRSLPTSSRTQGATQRGGSCIDLCGGLRARCARPGDQPYGVVVPADSTAAVDAAVWRRAAGRVRARTAAAAAATRMWASRRSVCLMLCRSPGSAPPPPLLGSRATCVPRVRPPLTDHYFSGRSLRRAVD
jgi:hypothetical protein